MLFVIFVFRHNVLVCRSNHLFVPGCILEMKSVSAAQWSIHIEHVTVGMTFSSLVL